MPAEHLRIMDNGYIGIYQGGYCPTCGLGGVNMYGMGRNDDGSEHNPLKSKCTPNAELVAVLREINQFSEEVVGLHYSDLIDILT